jgi:hypothetical protein
MNLACIALLAIIGVPVSKAAFSVVQVQLVTRAGDSGPVHRDVYTMQESSAALTPEGRLESFEAGRKLRMRYVDSHDGMQLPGIVEFDSNKVQVSLKGSSI